MDKAREFSEEAALQFLPSKIADAVRRTAALYHGVISEIRLRRGCPVYISAGERNICCGVLSPADDMDTIVRSLCGNSLYCHSETIRDGYICTEGGIRAGVCGRAVTEGGRIVSVTDISSIAIRIPHRVPGAADDICRIIMENGFRGAIIYSPPGVGKTTALREITARLSSKPYCIRIAVIDSRFEICGALGGDFTFDALSGYPRAKGIECAIRTLSPQLIICDEIGSSADAEAIEMSLGAGVPVIASAHAGSLEELCLKPYMAGLFDCGAFSHSIGLARTDGAFALSVERLSLSRRAEAALC